MKHCPRCHTAFADAQRFCDLDGTPLVSDDVPLSPQRRDKRTAAADTAGWKTLAIGTIAGLAIGLVLFVVYHRLTREVESDSPLASTPDAAGLQPISPNSVSLRPPATPAESPSPEQSPSPAAVISPAAVSVTPGLSGSEISTGSSKPVGAVIIRLTDGKTIEAEEAWESNGGIWYRQHGVVTFLSRDKVQSIETPATSSPRPAASPTPEKSETRN